VRTRRNDDERRTVRVLLALPTSFPPYPTSLVERCEAALETPLGNLSLEQLRLLIGQGFGLDILLPRALEVLERNPLISVTFWEGDLLAACLRVPAAFWKEHTELADSMRRVANRAETDDKLVTDARRAFLEALAEAN